MRDQGKYSSPQSESNSFFNVNKGLHKQNNCFGSFLFKGKFADFQPDLYLSESMPSLDVKRRRFHTVSLIRIDRGRVENQIILKVWIKLNVPTYFYFFYNPIICRDTKH